MRCCKAASAVVREFKRSHNIEAISGSLKADERHCNDFMMIQGHRDALVALPEYDNRNRHKITSLSLQYLGR